MKGCVLIDRAIIDSKIWRKPPLYLKVWLYLLMKANFKDGDVLKRGQCFVTVDEIADACAHYVGYRKMAPSKKHIYDILAWLRSGHEGDNEGDNEADTKVTTKVNANVNGEMLVTLLNYSISQDFDSYEGESEGDNEGTAKVTTKVSRTEKLPIEKHEKHENYEKHENNIPRAREVEALFSRLWEQYPLKRGKAQVTPAAKLRLYEVGEEHMLRAIARFKAEMQRLRRPIDKYPNGRTFFNTGYVDYLDENYTEIKGDTHNAGNQGFSTGRNPPSIGETI